MRRYDAIVLGAGPAGSSAAFFLADSGMRVAIVEKSEFPRCRVCGEFVSATTFPVLDAIGVGSALRAAGGPLTCRVGFYVGRQRFTAPMPTSEGGEGWGRTLARAVLDPALLDAARERGVTVFQPWKAAAMERTESEHTVTIEREGSFERLSAPVVVAAHGSWEIGSLPTQPAKRHAPDDVLAFKAFFHDAIFDEDLMILAAFPGGYGGMVHRDRDTVGLSFCVRRDVLERCRARYPAGNAWDSLLAHVSKHNQGVAEAVAGRGGERAARGGAIASRCAAALRGRCLPSRKRGGGGASDGRGGDQHGDPVGLPTREPSCRSWRLGRCGGALRASLGRAVRGAHPDRAAFAHLCMKPSVSALSIPVLRAFPGLLTAGAALSGKTKTLVAGEVSRA